MLQSIVILYISTVTSSTALPKRNVSSALKNGTGEAHWFPPPIYGPPLSPAIPTFITAHSGSLLTPSFYPQQSVYGQSAPLSIAQPYGFGALGLRTPDYVPSLPPLSPIETPPFALDHYYCSAQASFALVNSKEMLSSGSSLPSASFPPTGKSFDGPQVGLHISGGALPDIPIGTTRQFCRYTATLDDYACNQCCKIAARHYSTSLDEVTGILFAFDPQMPPVSPINSITGTSHNRKKRAPASGSSMGTTTKYSDSTIPTTSPELLASGNIGPASSETSLPVGAHMIHEPQIHPLLTPPFLQAVPRPVPQCFCCAPKKFISWT